MAKENVTRITGLDAIAYAEAHGLTLSKYADPVEDARDGLSVEKALEVAREDASLIYCDVPTKIERAKRGIAPAGWQACGGADADMAGVLWTDSAGDVYLGVAESTQAPIPDPCTWYRQPVVDDEIEAAS